MRTVSTRAAKLFAGRSLRNAVLLWLCVTSSLANCVVIADEPPHPFPLGFHIVPAVATLRGLSLRRGCACADSRDIDAECAMVARSDFRRTLDLTIHEAVQIALRIRGRA